MTNNTPPRLTLVTGASRGIGRETALHLARRGDIVIAAARSKAALEKLDDEIRGMGNEAILVPLDMKDAKGIDTLGNVIADKFGRLDGLVANAGVLGTLGPLETCGPRSFEETIEVNLTSNWRLIRALGPLLHKAESPRAVFVTSGVVPRPRAFWGPYQASKAGLEALIAAWVDESEQKKLRINLFDPGAVRTGMRAEAVPGEDPMTLPSPEEVSKQLADLVSADETRHGQRVVFKRA
jgi:NAD(P)-dependent dehydrogenase (short-subunit alcohol dehydrogenase family)